MHGGYPGSGFRLQTVARAMGLACRPWVLALALISLAGGCAREQEKEAFFPVLPPLYTVESEREALKVAQGLNPAGQSLRSWKELAPGLAASRVYVASKNKDEVAVAHGDVAVTWGEVSASLRLLETLLPRLDVEPELLATHFRWIKLTQGAHFSGYYESEVMASKTRTATYSWPLYGVPKDLQVLNLGAFKKELVGQRLVYRVNQGVVKPYYERKDIDSHGVLLGQGLELAWVRDPVDAFFLQVQGSGRLNYENGESEHILYGADNGLAYLSLGQYLSGRGLIEPGAVSMQSIRHWFSQHPEQRETVLNLNPRYVFFKKGETGPLGSLGSRLTPWVSLAVDRTTFPLGALLLFEVTVPEQPATGTALAASAPVTHGLPLRGIGLAQDTGGAITGRRVDLFCGSGERAAFVAGHLNTQGQTWMLVPRSAP